MSRDERLSSDGGETPLPVTQTTGADAPVVPSAQIQRPIFCRLLSAPWDQHVAFFQRCLCDTCKACERHWAEVKLALAEGLVSFAPHSDPGARASPAKLTCPRFESGNRSCLLITCNGGPVLSRRSLRNREGHYREKPDSPGVVLSAQLRSKGQLDLNKCHVWGITFLPSFRARVVRVPRDREECGPLGRRRMSHAPSAVRFGTGC